VLGVVGQEVVDHAVEQGGELVQLASSSGGRQRLTISVSSVRVRPPRTAVIRPCPLIQLNGRQRLPARGRAVPS